MTYLNNAILQVITHQYKKDAKEYHQIVEDAGYTIDKNYGHYYVRNPKTHRYVCMEYKKGYRNDYYELNWGSMVYGYKRFDNMPASIPFDFVAMLNKPYNRNGHYNEYSDKWNKSKAVERYVELKRLKRNLKNDEEDVETVLRQLTTLQQRLICATETKVKAAAELNSYRRECGLKERK